MTEGSRLREDHADPRRTQADCGPPTRAWPKVTAQALVGLLLTALLGCATGSSDPSPASPADILPDDSLQGRIVTVNPALRYVVIDFDLGRSPILDQRLSVYRQGVKIGEVKVSGPVMGTAAAGDILTGQAAVGDTVRED